MLAALVLVAEGPDEAGDGAEGEDEALKDVGGEGEAREERETKIDAEQEGEHEEQSDLSGEEELTAEPGESFAGGALVDVAAGGCGEGDGHDDGRLDEEASEVRCDESAEWLPATGGDADERGDAAESSERCEAEERGAGVGAAPALGAEPESVAEEAGGETGKIVDATAAVVHVPELGVPVAAPVVAVGNWDEARAEAEEKLVGCGESRLLRKCGMGRRVHERFSGIRRLGTRRASSG